MAPTFKPLDPLLAQIRVLDIDLSSPQLACRQRVASLQENPSFAALSYIWGDSTDLVAVSIDGQQTHITRNLYGALNWYRSWRPDLPIWADAICTNQNDVDEKNSQIQLMARVYRKAEHVICWMGPSSPTIETYLEHRSYLSNELTKSGQLRQARRWSLKRITFVARTRLSHKYKKKQTLRILQAARGEIEFLQLPYLQRMWTLQEVLLPATSNLVCVLDDKIRKYNFRSPMLLSMPRFVKTVAANIDPTTVDHVEAQVLEEVSSPTVLNGIAFMKSMQLSRLVIADCFKIKIRGDFFELERLLVATIYRQCTGSRNKIFAVLGLLYPIKETSSDQESKTGEQSRAATDWGFRDAATDVVAGPGPPAIPHRRLSQKS